MSHFEYVLTGVSFLVAIMIGRVISILSVLRMRNADFRHLSWLIVLTFHLMLYWWFGWRYRELSFTVHTYFAQIVPTLVLLFTVTMLTPREIPDNWSSFFDDQRKRFFTGYGVFWVLLSISQYIMVGEISPSILPIALCLLGVFSRSIVIQRSIPIVMGIAFFVIGLVLPESL